MAAALPPTPTASPALCGIVLRRRRRWPQSRAPRRRSCAARSPRSSPRLSRAGRGVRTPPPPRRSTPAWNDPAASAFGNVIACTGKSPPRAHNCTPPSAERNCRTRSASARRNVSPTAAFTPMVCSVRCAMPTDTGLQCTRTSLSSAIWLMNARLPGHDRHGQAECLGQRGHDHDVRPATSPWRSATLPHRDHTVRRHRRWSRERPGPACRQSTAPRRSRGRRKDSPAVAPTRLPPAPARRR